MKVKHVFAALISLLLLVSISQILPIPPFAGDIFPVYKSGYFRELDRGFKIVADSFSGLKTMARPEYAWIFLNDIEIADDMKISVYDHRGYRVPVPGEKAAHPDPQIVKIMNSLKPTVRSEIKGNSYISILPIYLKGECKFCHKQWNKREVVGALRFERKFDAMVFYSAERIIIFLLISILLGGLLYAVVRWDPGKNIKELFDK